MLPVLAPAAARLYPLFRSAFLTGLSLCFLSFGAWAQTAENPAASPLLLVRNSTGKAQLLRARSVMAGSVVQVVDADGAPHTLDSTAVILQLPWFADAELASGRVDLTNLIGRYEATAANFPEVATPLGVDVQKFTGFRAKLKQAADQRAADLQARVTALLAAHDDPVQNPSRDAVAAVVREADSLGALVPAQAADFARAAAPWRQHLAKLDAGQTFYAGEWRTPAALREFQANEASAAAARAFEQNLTLPLGAQALSASRVGLALAIPAVVLGVLFLWGTILLLRRQPGTGLLLMAGSVGLAVVLVLALLQNDLSLPLPPSGGLSAHAAESLSPALPGLPTGHGAASTPDREPQLTDADLNAFLHERTRFDTAATASGLHVEQLSAHIVPGGVTLYERATAAGRPVTVRFDVSIDATGATPQVTDYSVNVGAVPMPEPVKSWLWEGLATPLGRFLAEHHAAAAYAVTRFAPGEAQLASTRFTPPPAVVAQATPKPTVAPTATPAPMLAQATPPPAASTPSAFTADETPDTDQSQPLPPAYGGPDQKPSPDNTFFIYAIWDQIAGADETKMREQMDALIDQFGHGNRFHRVGFAFIMPNNETQLT